MEKKSIKFNCWNCRKEFEIEANLDARVEVACKRCGLTFEGPASAFSAHRSDGYSLQTPGKLAGNIKGIKIVFER
jgi:transcription elongation factor Elf1